LTRTVLNRKLVKWRRDSLTENGLRDFQSCSEKSTRDVVWLAGKLGNELDGWWPYLIRKSMVEVRRGTAVEGVKAVFKWRFEIAVSS